AGLRLHRGRGVDASANNRTHGVGAIFFRGVLRADVRGSDDPEQQQPANERVFTHGRPGCFCARWARSGSIAETASLTTALLSAHHTQAGSGNPVILPRSRRLRTEPAPQPK